MKLEKYLVLHGKTLRGQAMRPANWAERLADVSRLCAPSAPANRGFTRCCHPARYEGASVLVVNLELAKAHPGFLDFVRSFAALHELVAEELPEGRLCAGFSWRDGAP